MAITEISASGGIGIDGYGAAGLPSGLGIDTGSGAISGTPDAADAGTATATVTASDTAGNTDTVDITFPAVARGDQALTGFEYSAASVTFGSAAPTVTAPSGARTALSYSAAPDTVCTVDASSGALMIVGVGGCVVTATAAGTANYNEDTDTYTVTVQAAGTLVLNVSAIATDNRVNIAEKAAGFSIGGDTGSVGGVSVTVTVGTGELAATSSTEDPATWSVSVPADAPYISGASVDVEVNASKAGYTAPGAAERALAVDLVAPTAPSYTAPVSLKVGVAITEISASGGTGIDGYGAAGLPSGLGIDTGSGAISGTPDAADAGTATATVTASDTAGNTDTVDITFPAVARGDQALTGFEYSAASVTFGSAAPTVTAPSGARTALSYSAAPDTVCTVDASSGALMIVGVGGCVVTATAAGTANYNEDTDTYTVTVQAAGTLVLNVSAIATDNRVNIAEKAAGFSIGGDTGSVGGVSVTVTVGTGELAATSSTEDPATWSVSVPADAPYISGASVDVEVNASKAGYTAPGAAERALAVDLVAPTAPTYAAPSSLKVGVAITEISASGGIGIDGYGAAGLPSGLGIDTGSGAISGTPDAADAGTATATVTASDTAGNTDTVDITFPAVARGDQALTGFEYSAASVTFGSAAPTVTAPSGARTTLSYSAAPDTVCTVDASSGALTIVGVGGCVVTATAAGTANYNEDTATYTVTVQAAVAPGAPAGLGARGTGSKVVLGWTAPVVTGSGGLSGYTLYRGDGGACDNLSALSLSIAEDATSAEDATVSSGNTYCYELTAISDLGGEGSPSASVVARVVNPSAPTGLAVTLKSASAIGLGWTAPADDGGGALDGYNVLRCEEGQAACTPGYLDWVPLADGTSYADDAVTAGTEYRYAVQSSRLAAPSAWSEQVVAVAEAAVAPGAPTGLAARANGEQAVLSWAAPGDGGNSALTGYTLYRGAGDSCGNLTSLRAGIGAGERSAEDTGVTEGGTYCYRLTASNALAGEGAGSNTAVVVVAGPSAPTGLAVTLKSASAIGLAWTAPADDGGGALDGYNVLRCEEGQAACTPAYLDWVPLADGTSYADDAVAVGAEYRYAVQSSRLSALSAWSNEVTAVAEAAVAPGAPAGLAARANGEKAVLSWAAPGDSGNSALTGYTLYRGAGDSCGNLTSLRAGIGAGERSAEDTGVTEGGTYCYRLTASNALAGEGAGSNTAVVVVAGPSAPTGLAVTLKSASAIGLGWTAPADDGGGALDGYNVLRCEEGQGACTPAYLDWVPLADGTSYADDAVTAGTEYRYAVQSSRLAAPSAWSEQVVAVAEAAVAPGAPTGLAARANGEKAVLSWAAPGDSGNSALTGYTLYRGAGDSCGNLTSLRAGIGAGERSAEDTGVTEGGTYCYRLTASNALAGEGAGVEHGGGGGRGAIGADGAGGHPEERVGDRSGLDGAGGRRRRGA